MSRSFWHLRFVLPTQLYFIIFTWVAVFAPSFRITADIAYDFISHQLLNWSASNYLRLNLLLWLELLLASLVADHLRPRQYLWVTVLQILPINNMDTKTSVFCAHRIALFSQIKISQGLKKLSSRFQSWHPDKDVLRPCSWNLGTNDLSTNEIKDPGSYFASTHWPTSLFVGLIRSTSVHHEWC